MQTRTQRTPIKPITKKGVRQPKFAASGTMINGAIAAPVFTPIWRADAALLVSFAGNHLDTTAFPLGNAPDSPIPNRNRVHIRVISPVVAPVSAVNNDHHSTILIKLLR